MKCDKTNIGFFKRVEPYLVDYINGKASFKQTTHRCNDVLVKMKLEKSSSCAVRKILILRINK